ncbi:MAG: STY0301 family protein, partial [Telluria sp.]
MPKRRLPNMLIAVHAGLFFLAIRPVGAAGAPMTADCPATLPKSAIKVAPTTGWADSAPDDLILAVAGMMNGPPDSELFLIPARQARTKRAVTASWDFQPVDEKWLYCGYGSVTGGMPAVQIGLRMDDKARSCTLTIHEDEVLAPDHERG